MKQRAGETPPFPGNVKPARKGVYKRVIAGFEDTPYSYWDGRQWHVQIASPTHARMMPISGYQAEQMAGHFTWRGLAEKP